MMGMDAGLLAWEHTAMSEAVCGYLPVLFC